MRASITPSLIHPTDTRLLGAMLGLTISRRAIQVPTKRFATRSISRPAVSFRPRTSLTTHSLPFRPSFNAPFTRFFHREIVGFSTPDTPETPEEQKNAEKREQDLSRYVGLVIHVGGVQFQITVMNGIWWLGFSSEPSCP